MQQRRNEVRWRPGQEATSEPPCSNLRSFESKSTALKNALVILLGVSAPLAVISGPGELCPLAAPRYAPAVQSVSAEQICIIPRGVTRLDGAWGKKQLWLPHIWIWSLMEANWLYWRKYLWHCWISSAPPAVIRRPHSDSAPGELLPLAPARYAPEWYSSICNRNISGEFIVGNNATAFCHNAACKKLWQHMDVNKHLTAIWQKCVERVSWPNIVT